MTNTNPEQACRKYREADDLAKTGLDVQTLSRMGWGRMPQEPRTVWEQELRPYHDFKRFAFLVGVILTGLVLVGYFSNEIAGMITFFDEVK